MYLAHHSEFQLLDLLLLRLLLHRNKRNLQLPLYEYTFGFEETQHYRKAQGSYLRRNQWEDLTIKVWVNV